MEPPIAAVKTCTVNPGGVLRRVPHPGAFVPLALSHGAVGAGPYRFQRQTYCPTNLTCLVSRITGRAKSPGVLVERLALARPARCLGLCGWLDWSDGDVLPSQYY